MGTLPALHDQLIETDRSFEWRQVSGKSGERFEIVEDIYNDRTIRGTKSAPSKSVPLGNEPAHFFPAGDSSRSSLEF